MISKNICAITKNIGAFSKSICAFIKNIGTIPKNICAITKNIGTFSKSICTFIKNICTIPKNICAIPKNIGAFSKSICAITKNIGAFSKSICTFIKNICTFSKNICAFISNICTNNNNIAVIIKIQNTFLLFPGIFLSLQTFSQDWQWAVKAGGFYSDKATDMDMDTAGFIYVSGYYNEFATFGSLNAPSTFGKDGFVAKLDTAGNFIWVKTADGGWDERVLGMCADKFGYVYATGTCWYDTDFGSCSTPFFPGGADNIFVAKLDLNGNCQWLIGAGGDSDDQGYDLIADDSGNVYLTGFISDEYFSGTPAYFGSIAVPIPFGDSIAFVAKINPAGIFQWVQTFPGTDGERDNRIAIDDSSNVYITGGFIGAQMFGTTLLTSAGERDVFVIKYNSNGNFIWATRAGGILDDRTNSIVVDMFGEVYVTGEFRNKAGFGTDSINNNGGPNGRDIFVAKMKQNGNWVWAKKAGSSQGGERGDRIVADKQGNIFVTGQFIDTASFGQNITLIATVAESLQVFVASIDTSGKWLWALQGGGMEEDRGNSLVCDDSCNLYNAGYFRNNPVFGNDSFTTTGAKDIFVAKIVSACYNSFLPDAGFLANTYEICIGANINFSDTSTNNPSTWEWTFQGGVPSVSISQNPTVFYNTAGTFSVQLIVTNNYGTDTAWETITVNPFPAAYAGEDTCILEGTSAVLTASGGTSYQWNTGEITTGITVSPSETTDYIVIVEQNNCSTADLVTVNVFSPVEISGETIICTGQTVLLTASNGTGYLWNTGETTKSIYVSPQSSMEYFVTVTNDCDTSLAASITITVNPLPEVFAGNDTSVLMGTRIHLTASGGVNYLWNTGATTNTIIVQPPVTTTYSVTATDNNGCSNTDEVTVTIDDAFFVAVPNIFSPNGDLVNDKLYVYGKGIKNLTFTIFSRWGVKVFETDNYLEGWDGTFKGKPMNTGVFVYSVKGKFVDYTDIDAKGNVTLVR